MRTKKVYLHEADEYVGPFRSRLDAERFVALMGWFGVSSEGIEIVELEISSAESEPCRARLANANPLFADAHTSYPR